MNLPSILDVAIGLIFMYLILSLLASEIQEIISALLQWRAKHLRESITNLLQGGETLPIPEQKQVQELVSKIYDNPLIRNINQTANKGMAKSCRQITWILPTIIEYTSKNIKQYKTRTIDDDKSAPSYIPAETFATTLIESIGISVLSKLLIAHRLEKFIERVTSDIQEALNNILVDGSDAKKKYDDFKDKLKQIIKDYKNSEATLKTCINRMIEYFERMSISCQNVHNITAQNKKELESIKTSFFGRKGERAYLFGLSPTPSELIELIDKESKLYKDIKPQFENILDENSSEYKIAKEIDNQIESHLDCKTKGKNHITKSSILKNLNREDLEIYRTYYTHFQINLVIDGLPQYVKNSLKILARRAESRNQDLKMEVQSVDNKVEQLRKEIELWFDRSMDRASGVYKRNSKGFGIMLGFVLALLTNSDTFHVFSRISNDEKLRQVIVQNAANYSQQYTSKQNNIKGIEDIKKETDDALNGISLPIGWNPTIIKQQLNCIDQNKEKNNKWDSIYKCKSFPNPFGILAKIMIVLVGWLITGIAISMGASFWFDLLNKVINVRNTGKPPQSSTDDL